MPDMTCLYSVFGILFFCAAAGLGYRFTYISLPAPHINLNAVYGTAILPSASPNTYK